MKNKKERFSLNNKKINHPKNGFEKEYNEVKAWCQSQKMEEWYIKSFDGLKLHASFFPADNPKRIVLMSHGYRGSRFGSIAHIAKYLHENNCSLLFIDQRCCGESQGRFVTFGAKEQFDVRKWIRVLHKNNYKKLPIYLYGQSMGAATVLIAAGHKLPTEVKGIIADCGFHSMKRQLGNMAEGWFNNHFVELVLFRLDAICREFGGFRMKDADTTEALKCNTRPVLFFHGLEDTYVLPENTEINFRLCKAPKEKIMIPGARHLCSSYVDPELYKKKVMEFFEKYDT